AAGRYSVAVPRISPRVTADRHLCTIEADLIVHERGSPVADATRPTVAIRDLHWLKHIAPLQGPVIVSLMYYLGAQAAFFIGTFSDKIFALFWPPNVILFCALMFVSQRRWWLYILAVFPAHAIAEHGVGMPVPQMLVAFVTNCMVALLNAYAVR